MTAPTLTELVETLESFLSPELRARFADGFAIMKGRDAPSASDADVAFAGRMFMTWQEEVPVLRTLTAEQRIALDRKTLDFYEGLAEKGEVFSMRYASFAYANGDCHQEAEHSANGYSIHAFPDHEKAVFWCRKAVEAGDDVAARALPSLERDLAESRQKPSAPSAPPPPQP